jgi:hypothetical protein
VKAVVTALDGKCGQGEAGGVVAVAARRTEKAADLACNGWRSIVISGRAHTVDGARGRFSGSLSVGETSTTLAAERQGCAAEAV